MHRGYLLVALLVVLLSACGGGDVDVCTPNALRGTCVETLARLDSACFDPSGTCVWSRPDGGVMFEWENGARIEEDIGLPSTPSTSYSSEGTVCGRSMAIKTDDCVGIHIEISGMSLDSCVDRSTDGKQIEAVRYRCQNGREYRLAYNKDLVDQGACQTQTPNVADCVDEDGKRLGGLQ